MYLQTNNHKFYVKYKKYEKNVYFYSIGNTNNKPKACITISVMPIKNDLVMSIQDIEYFSTCSIDHLEKGFGSVEMLQGSIKAILKRHPNVNRIELQDKSFFTLSNKDRIPLPEYRLLTKGKTWYEEHFGARPQCKSFKYIVDMYKEAWASNKVQMPSALTEVSFKQYLKILHFPSVISGNAWYIPLKKIGKYIFDGDFKHGSLGGMLTTINEISNKSPITYTFRLFA